MRCIYGVEEMNCQEEKIPRRLFRPEVSLPSERDAPARVHRSSTMPLHCYGSLYLERLCLRTAFKSNLLLKRAGHLLDTLFLSQGFQS